MALWISVPPENRRSVVVELTETGDALFEKVFPAHIANLKQRVSTLEPSELALLEVLLNRLQQMF